MWPCPKMRLVWNTHRAFWNGSFNWHLISVSWFLNFSHLTLSLNQSNHFTTNTILNFRFPPIWTFHESFKEWSDMNSVSVEVRVTLRSWPHWKLFYFFFFRQTLSFSGFLLGKLINQISNECLGCVLSFQWKYNVSKGCWGKSARKGFLYGQVHIPEGH